MTIDTAVNIQKSPTKLVRPEWMSFNDIPQLSYKDVSYTTEIPELKPFYKYSVNRSAFQEVIADKSKFQYHRQTLAKVLKEQYASLDTTDLVKNHIRDLEQDNTYTIITAHQPSLFTGPLYYIYKIISTINLCQQLKEHYPKNNFVPVFVTGGEDHDFEEVNYINLFNQKVVWENNEAGSVGKMSTQSLTPTLAHLKEILGTSEKAAAIFSIIEKAYTQNEIYSNATVQLVNELFKEYGLVVVNMNHPELKKLFIPYIKEEILNQPSQALVESTCEALSTINFKQQAHPRAINFFYLRDNLRERIVEENGVFKVLNTDYAFTREEIIQEIDDHPEYFSPNVVMRPIYQEAILPNLAYIGGGGELAYWLERKEQFAHFGVPYPMLIRRNSVMWIDKGTHKKITKLGLTVADLFQDEDHLVRQYIENNTSDALEISEEKKTIAHVFDNIVEKGRSIDPTLAKALLAEKTKQLKVLDQLEGRLLRAEKQKHETAINQIKKLKEKLYPNNGLQERYDNFLSLYLKYGKEWFDILLEHLDPLKKEFLVIVDE